MRSKVSRSHGSRLPKRTKRMFSLVPLGPQRASFSDVVAPAPSAWQVRRKHEQELQGDGKCDAAFESSTAAAAETTTTMKTTTRWDRTRCCRKRRRRSVVLVEGVVLA